MTAQLPINHSMATVPTNESERLPSSEDHHQSEQVPRMDATDSRLLTAESDSRALVVPATSVRGEANSATRLQMQRESNLPQVVIPDFLESEEINFPQVIDACPPEALNKDLPEVVGEKQDARRKRARLWLILAALVFLVVVCIAVVGGVFGSRSGKSKPLASKTTGTPEPAPQPSGSPQLLPSTSLVSFNYTDNDGTDHHRVVFQKTDGVIYQSAWNSSERSWAITAVSAPWKQQHSKTNLDVRNGTPMAGGVSLSFNTTRNFHFFYLDKSRNAIRELFVENDPDGLWTTGPSDGRFIADTTSRLAWYGRACLTYCKNYDVLFFQQPEDRRVQYLLSGSDMALTDTSVTQAHTGSTLPVPGTSFGIVPVRSSNESEQGLAVFMNAGNLVEIRGGQQFDILGPFSSDLMGSNASIASFAWGDISVGAGTGNKQVLLSKPDGVDNGVAMWSFDGSWTKHESVAELSDIRGDSALAANSAGRIYGLTDGSGGIELMEWIWDQEGLVFEKLGVVHTG